MGKSIALALPFIIAIIIFLFWVFYRAGKAAGRSEAPQRANQTGSKLLLEADQLFSDLMFVTNIENDDVLTENSRWRINTWRSNYMKAKIQ